MYNLACSYARLDQKDAAFDWLFKALDAGFDATGRFGATTTWTTCAATPASARPSTSPRAREKSEDD